MAWISQKLFKEIKDYCQEKRDFRADVSQEKKLKRVSYELVIHRLTIITIPFPIFWIVFYVFPDTE